MWNEENNQSEETWNHPNAAAKFFLTMALDLQRLPHRRARRARPVRACRTTSPSSSRRWARRTTPRPRSSGSHNYSDTTNRYRSSGTALILKTSKKYVKKAKFWLTETGGVASFGANFPVQHVAPEQGREVPVHARQEGPQGISRLYSYASSGRRTPSARPGTSTPASSPTTACGPARSTRRSRPRPRTSPASHSATSAPARTMAPEPGVAQLVEAAPFKRRCSSERAGSNPAPGMSTLGGALTSVVSRGLLRVQGNHVEASVLEHAGSSPLRGSTPLLRLAGDERLVTLTRRGNQAAFEALVARYQARLLAFCRHMVGTREDAEDVLQEVFAAAFNAMLADDRPITCAVAVPDRAQPVAQPAAQTQAIGVDSMDIHVADHGVTTAEKAHKREEFRQLMEDVGTLPETQRTALLLREIDALSYEQDRRTRWRRRSRRSSRCWCARASRWPRASEARALSCEDVRDELGEVAEGIKLRLGAPARRHGARLRPLRRLPQAAARDQTRRSHAVPGRAAAGLQEGPPRPRGDDRQRGRHRRDRRGRGPPAAGGTAGGRGPPVGPAPPRPPARPPRASRPSRSSAPVRSRSSRSATTACATPPRWPSPR